MKSNNDSLLILAGLGLAAAILTQSASAEPECTDTTWTCDTTDRLEHSNCGNTRETTPCSLASDATEMIAGTIPVDLRYDVNDNGIVDTDDVTLLKTGTPLRDLHPANITATSFPIPTIPFGTYNTMAIDITWTNIGEQYGSFIPQVQVGSDVPIDLSSEITLNPGETYNKEETIPSIPSGSQTICPLPGTAEYCQIIDVPACIDTTWTCNTDDRLEYSNCGNVRETTSCSLASDAAEMIAGTIPVDLKYDVNDNGTVDNDDVSLLMGGTSLRDLHPANITCTYAPDPTSSGLSEIDISFAWTNTGEVSEEFTPAVSINGGDLINITESPVDLAPGETHSFVKALTGLSLSPGETYTVCPSPN